MVDQSIEKKLKNLRVWNIVVGLILGTQAVVVALMTNDFSLPVTSTFLEGPPGTTPSLQVMFNIPTGWGVFAFLAISSLALLLTASPIFFNWYKRNLIESRNYGRWIEYFFSSSIMIVLISQIAASATLPPSAIFGINACMILFGALQEKRETGQTEPASILVRQLCRHYSLDCYSYLRIRSGGRRRTAHLRLCYYHFVVHIF